MALGPAGAALLRNRMDSADDGARSTPFANLQATKTMESGQLQTYFKAAMDKFIRDRERQNASYPIAHERYVPDVDMESVESYRDQPGEQEQDRKGLGDPRRPQVATAGTAPTGGFGAQRIRLSAMTDLKGFSGRDQDEERARSWFNKMKTAFLRDQAPDDEKCLVFGDLLTGPARNWYNQLDRSTRNEWKRLSESFMIQYGGYGMSAGRQYYHARKRQNETPLEYLHRLNVAGMRAKVAFRDGSSATQREHVEHFIDTLDDRELAKQLTLLRVHDANTMEETLRAYQRMSFRQNKEPTDSNKYRSRSAATSAPIYSKTPRAVKAIRVENEEIDSGSSSDGSDEEEFCRKVCVTTASDPVADPEEQRDRSRKVDRYDDRDRGRVPKACTHCGSKRHDDRGCWKRLTCQKCGSKGHPSDKCLHVCPACGEVHESGQCPMEEFYNLIRKWYVPTKRAGLLPANVEEMLN